MRVNVLPGDMLIARCSHLGDHGIPARVVEIRKGDMLFVVSSVAAAPRHSAEVYVEDPDLIEGMYPDRYYVQALWRSILIETIVITDDPFCNVVRRPS